MYQVLARKYRPKNFHELLGQAHVSKALVNAITNERLHHAYLFTGTRGVGKTTIARILAKCLNCETGITSEPCGMCSVCQSIDNGRFIDLIEIDAASRTKVEDTRELLDNVPYAPTQGRYKVYLIDEVHMLSTHSFNALLKTLEEPPAHVKFLLATTDPQKLPITIISRCLQFVLRPLPELALAEYLGTILDKEKIPYESDALWQLASSAKGSVRDALSLTDQAIAFGNGQVTETIIRQMLGLIDQADVIALIFNIYEGNTAKIAHTLQLLREQVVDAKAVFDRLAEVLHQLAILQAIPNFDLQINRQQYQALQQLAQQLPAELLQLYYDIVVKSRENLALANTPMQALEMGILRLMVFKPLHTHELPIPITQAPQPEVVVDNHLLEPSVPSVPLPDITAAANEAAHSLAPLPLPNEPVPCDAMPPPLTEIVINDAQPPLVESDATPEALQPDNLSDASQQAPVGVNSAISSAQQASVVATVPPLANKDHDLPVVIAPKGSPLALLQPQARDLTGEWTPEKWDYWVYQAREQGWLAEDELVLAKRGIMMGNIHGDSQFLTAEAILSHTATFQNFCQKLAQSFAGIQIELATSDASSELLAQQPEIRQQARAQLAIQQATSLLEQQAVTQALLQQNASLSSVKLLS